MRPLAIFGDLTRSYAILRDLKRFLAMPSRTLPERNGRQATPRRLTVSRSIGHENEQGGGGY